MDANPDSGFQWVTMGYHVTIKNGMASLEPFGWRNEDSALRNKMKINSFLVPRCRQICDEECGSDFDTEVELSETEVAQINDWFRKDEYSKIEDLIRAKAYSPLRFNL